MRIRRRDLTIFAGGFAAGCTRLPARVRNDLRLGASLEPPHLDPTSGAAAAIDEIVYANVFEGLTRIDAQGRVQPALAHSWERSADGRSYVFQLHPGVQFHDGAPCDASTVKFSLDRACAPGSTNAQHNLFEPIANVVALDPTRVRIALKRPVSLPDNLAWGDAVIVSPASAGTNVVHPIGTGPFRFKRWARGALVQLEKAPHYWGEPARLDGATFAFIPDPSALLAALLSGDVDGFPDFTAPELLPLVQRDGRFRVAIGASQGETIVALNNTRTPLNDLRVRRALSHAIDRSAIITGAMSGYGVPIGSHFPPTDPAYVDLTGLYPYDPALARRLLDEAGVRGWRPSLKLPPTYYARRAGEIVAAQLRSIGVTPRIENIEWAQWLEQVFAHKDYDLTIVAHTEPRDFDIYGRDDFYFNYHSSTFKALLSDLDAAPDETAKRAILQSIQRHIADDAVNVFLFEFPKIGVWRKELEGVWVDAPTQANDLTRAHWMRPI